jgi:SAM-dependent methyltransferase
MADAPGVRSEEAIGRFRRALERAGFTEQGVRDAMGMDPGSTRPPDDAQVYLRRMAEPSALHTLVKLFVLGVDVPATEAAAALAPLDLEEGSALGLIDRAEGDVRRALSIATVQGMWLVHDPLTADPSAMRPDHVIGPGPSSRTLSALTVRVPVRSALDLGTGSGIQALLAARHAERVVATDPNDRALSIAAFNARLNGVENVECRAGSFYEPVAEERFDLIVSNPPFVISPETSHVFRDSDLPGDAVSREVVRGAADRLVDGGFATVLCNWVQRTGEGWADTPRRWAEGIGCDAWVLHSESQDPLSYAARWLTRTGGPEYGRALDRWIEYDRELGAQAIVTGAVVLRRRSGPGWFRAEHVPGARSDDATAHLLRMFANQDYLHGVRDDRMLLGGRYRLAPEHRVEQTLAFRGEGYEVERILLSFERGLAFVGSLDAFGLRVLSGCDGRTTLDELVQRAARAMDVEVTEVVPVAVAIVRQMLSLGFLEIPDGPSDAG